MAFAVARDRKLGLITTELLACYAGGEGSICTGEAVGVAFFQGQSIGVVEIAILDTSAIRDMVAKCAR